MQQQCDRVRARTKLDHLQQQLGEKELRIQQLEIETKQQSFNNELLRGLHRRMGMFEDTIIPMQTTAETRYTIMELMETPDDEDWLDPEDRSGESNV